MDSCAVNVVFYFCIFFLLEVCSYNYKKNDEIGALVTSFSNRLNLEALDYYRHRDPIKYPFF